MTSATAHRNIRASSLLQFCSSRATLLFFHLGDQRLDVKRHCVVSLSLLPKRSAGIVKAIVWCLVTSEHPTLLDRARLKRA